MVSTITPPTSTSTTIAATALATRAEHRATHADSGRHNLFPASSYEDAEQPSPIRSEQEEEPSPFRSEPIL
jgi:hypothetical protein